MKYIWEVIKKSNKEVIYKIITSLFIQGLLLIIPIFWSKAINEVSNGEFNKTYFLLVITLILSILYYFWSYLNQKTWFKLYNKLYLEYTNIAIGGSKDSITNLTLGEYTNILNSDIDVLCTFLGNSITRVIQVFEFVIIYIYFLSLDFIIFLITFIISILMIMVFVLYSKGIKKENIARKTNLDKKTIQAHELYNCVFYKKRNFTKRHHKLYESSVNYLRSHYKFNVLANSIIYTVLGIFEVARYGLIIYGTYLVFLGEIEIGTILLIYSYYSKIISNFEVLGTISAEYQGFKVSLFRLNKLDISK